MHEDLLQTLRYPTKAQVRAQGRRGKWPVQFDMASWFGQFALSESLRPFYAFRFAGETFALKTLCIGERQAFEFAQAATWALVAFDFPPDVVASTMIDNVRFIGRREGVLVSGREFLKRCDAVGAIINESELEVEFEPRPS